MKSYTPCMILLQKMSNFTHMWKSDKYEELMLAIMMIFGRCRQQFMTRRRPTLSQHSASQAPCQSSTFLCFFFSICFHFYSFFVRHPARVAQTCVFVWSEKSSQQAFCRRHMILASLRIFRGLRKFMPHMWTSTFCA